MLYAPPILQTLRLALRPLHACKMRANGSARSVGQRTAEHGRSELTWENTTNCGPTTPVITGPFLLLICGFVVQVPGGAPCQNFGSRSRSRHRQAARPS